MKRTFILSATIAALMVIFPATTATAQNVTEPYIDISTKVHREVMPDELYLRITISEKDYKGKKSLEELQRAMIKALEKNGIDISESLTLNYMGSDISYKIFSKKVVPNSEATYILKLHDATTMQQVIASLEEQQISSIERERVKFTKVKELKQEMAVEAMKQAQAEAKVLAGAIGQEIGKAITISTWTDCDEQQANVMYNSKLRDLSFASFDEVVVVPTLNISKTTYTFRANVRFELK